MFSRIQILHVDDDPSFLDLTAEFLKHEDDRFTLDTAINADKGLEILADRTPDCIISDYDMPKENGIEFLANVRKEYSELPFILFTGKGSEEVASDAISNGATDYLQKESGTDQYELLANRIRNAVQAHRAAHEVERQQDLMSRAEMLGSVGSWELHYETQTLRMTRGLKKLYGLNEDQDLSLAETVGLYDKDSQEAIERVIEGAVETGYAETADLHFQRVDGEQRIAEGNAELAENTDDETILRGVIRDITERKECEGRLTRTQMLLSKMEELADIGAWEYDPETGVPTNTAGMKRIYGIDPAADLTLDEGFEFFHPADRDRLRDQFDACLETGESYEMDIRVVTAAGDQKWVTVQGERADTNRTGTTIRGYVQDITEHKEREQELKAQNE